MASLSAAASNPAVQKHAILRLQGPDAKGVISAFAQLLYGHGANIVDSEQYTDIATNLFYQRIVFDRSTIITDRRSVEAGIAEVCARFKMESTLSWGGTLTKIAIFVSQYDHALWELLLRHRSGELACEIACIVSNHSILSPIAAAFSVPFHVFEITKDTKALQEAAELKLLKELGVDLVILARYMQIVTDDFCRAFPHKVINIHHSFLPAFVGSKPYHRAYERGVKLIGATAHYATADLDEGPIIEQNTVRITHKDGVEDLIAKGRILEKTVLTRAVQKHLEEKTLVSLGRVIVFGD